MGRLLTSFWATGGLIRLYIILNPANMHTHQIGYNSEGSCKNRTLEKNNTSHSQYLLFWSKPFLTLALLGREDKNKSFLIQSHDFLMGFWSDRNPWLSAIPHFITTKLFSHPAVTKSFCSGLISATCVILLWSLATFARSSSASGSWEVFWDPWVQRDTTRLHAFFKLKLQGFVGCQTKLVQSIRIVH